jgi:hypothetical protein
MWFFIPSSSLLIFFAVNFFLTDNLQGIMVLTDEFALAHGSCFGWGKLVVLLCNQ